MRRAAAVTAIGLLLALGTGCGLFGDDQSAPPATATCTGTDDAAAVHVLQSGPGPLPGGGRAVLTEAHPDTSPPTARLSLLGVAQGEATAAEVSIDGTVTVQAKKYKVVQICTDHVALLAQ